MGEYVKNKKEMKFKNQESLKAVENVIVEANEALHDKGRNLTNSPFSETIAGALGAGAGGVLGFAGLYFGGTVGLSAAGITSGLATAGGLIGGGMAAGIAVLAAPAVVLGTGAALATSRVKNKKLREAKELVYKEALAKQTAICKALKEEADADKERFDYLNGLNLMLKAAIKDLQHDLGVEA
jgi:hypothetical protein